MRVASLLPVGEASAREAHHRRLDLHHLVHKFLADSIHIRNFGILADPDSVVDDAAQVLDEVAVDIGRDRAEDLVEYNFNAAGNALRESEA